MKKIPATILVFDSKSSPEEVRKYIGEYAFLFDGDEIDFDNYVILESVSMYENCICFSDVFGEEYKNFASIKIDNK